MSNDKLTEEDLVYIRALRARGFAVSVFTPKECGYADINDVEDAMVAGGWDEIKRGLQGAEQMKTVFNSEQAVSEGWALFDVDGRVCLQRIDEANKFHSDAHALVHVAMAAYRGSAYHWGALHLIGSRADDTLWKLDESVWRGRLRGEVR